MAALPLLRGHSSRLTEGDRLSSHCGHMSLSIPSLDANWVGAHQVGVVESARSSVLGGCGGDARMGVPSWIAGWVGLQWRGWVEAVCGRGVEHVGSRVVPHIACWPGVGLEGGWREAMVEHGSGDQRRDAALGVLPETELCKCVCLVEGGGEVPAEGHRSW